MFAMFFPLYLRCVFVCLLVFCESSAFLSPEGMPGLRLEEFKEGQVQSLLKDFLSALSPSPLFSDLVKRPEPVTTVPGWEVFLAARGCAGPWGVSSQCARPGLTCISHPGNQPQHPLIQCTWSHPERLQLLFDQK